MCDCDGSDLMYDLSGVWAVLVLPHMQGWKVHSFKAINCLMKMLPISSVEPPQRCGQMCGQDTMAERTGRQMSCVKQRERFH